MATHFTTIKAAQFLSYVSAESSTNKPTFKFAFYATVFSTLEPTCEQAIFAAIMAPTAISPG